jgi:hypothetical protein
MATQTSAGGLRTVGLGAVLIGAGLIGLLMVGIGPEATVGLIRTVLLTVAYVTVPIVVLAALLGLYFKFNAWRQ